MSGEPRKVLILSADIGEGHDGPARAIQREFSELEPEAKVTIVNGLTAMGGVLTSVVRDGSEVTFKWFPMLFEIQYRLFMKFGPTRWFSQKLLTRIGSRPLLRIVKAHSPDLIISTYPGVTVALGEMRLKGKLNIPTIAGITDLAGLYFWAHKGIDMHTVTHRESIETVEKIAGAGSVKWALPPTSPIFLDPPTREQARRDLGIPETGDVIIVSGGGWGVGDVTGGIQSALSRKDAHVIALCGRNQPVKTALETEFHGEERLSIIGFTDRMATYLSAGDVLIHATGGLTALEAMICGTKVISYGFGVGHVRENNKAYQALGLAQVVKQRDELPAAIALALEDRSPRDPRYAQLPSTAEISRDMHRYVTPTPAWKWTARRAVVGVAAAAAMAWLVLGSNAGFNLFDGPLRLKTADALPTKEPVVGVIVDVNQAGAAAAAAAAKERGLAVSIAFSKPPGAATVSHIRAAGAEPLPQLGRSGAFGWIATRSRLNKMKRDLGLRKPFAYQPPLKGFSVGEYESAKSLGGKPVEGRVTIDSHSVIGELERGEIVVIKLDGSVDSLRAFDSLRSALALQSLAAVPVSSLLKR